MSICLCCYRFMIQIQVMVYNILVCPPYLLLEMMIGQAVKQSRVGMTHQYVYNPIICTMDYHIVLLTCMSGYALVCFISRPVSFMLQNLPIMLFGISLIFSHCVHFYVFCIFIMLSFLKDHDRYIAINNYNK